MNVALEVSKGQRLGKDGRTGKPTIAQGGLRPCLLSVHQPECVHHVTVVGCVYLLRIATQARSRRERLLPGRTPSLRHVETYDITLIGCAAQVGTLGLR